MRMTAKEFLEKFPDHPAAKSLREDPAPSTSSQKAVGRKTAKKQGPSHLEAMFSQQLLAMKSPPPEREFRFHPTRQWRMDFAWPARRVAVEVEGGVWNMGRHNRPRGFIADTDKYNSAAELGWVVLRFTAQAIRSGKAVDQTLDVLKERACLEERYEPDPAQSSMLRRRARPKS